LPEIGQNKILQAASDYVLMEEEVASLKASLAQHVDISNKLLAENEALKGQIKTQADFLTRQIDAVTTHRDRLNTALQGYIIRYRVIRQTIEAAETEALQQGLMQEKLQDPPVVPTKLGLPAPSLS